MSEMFDEPTQQISSHQRSVCPASGSDKLVPLAVIACHPDPNRLGEFATLDALAQVGEQTFNRYQPEFHGLHNTIGQGLAVPHVSRKSLHLQRADKTNYILHRRDYSAAVSVNEQPLESSLKLTQDDFDDGFFLTLGEHVLLFIKCIPEPAIEQDDFGLVGISKAVQEVRTRIRTVAPMDEPVLIRGATGTGKELVAQALQRQSSRFGKPYVVANIPALQPSLAVAELFGASKGAFTGASHDRKGYFQAADGGTLFLDEIGEASAEVQAMLLRALESHEVVPVGTTTAANVDVRIIAATDADLSEDGEKAFKQPLLHRLSTYQLFLTPLADRPEDIPALLKKFLTEQWQKLHGHAQLPFSAEQPWLSCALMKAFMGAPWPGNVRQLRNFARQLTVENQGRPALQIDRQMLASLQPLAAANERGSTAPAKVESSKRKPSQISPEELSQTLEKARFDRQTTAEMLGVSRGSVYEMIKRHPDLRLLSDIDDEELQRTYQQCGGDLEQLMWQTQASQASLRRRLNKLGIDSA